MADMTLLEMLTRLAFTVGCTAAAIWAFYSFAVVWEQRKQRLQSARPHPLDELFRAGWDYIVDGTLAAKLIYLGPPEDLNTMFIPYEVDIMPGHRKEVETLLYGSSLHQTSDDERVCYRSRADASVMLKDSEVLIHYDASQEDRITMKAMFP